MSNLGLFEPFVFMSWKGVFFILEYRKRHFLGVNCLKKKVGKMAISGLKAWVNAFAKMSIFKRLVFIA